MAPPPVSRMIGPSARQARNTPEVLTSKVFSMISSVSSSSLWCGIAVVQQDVTGFFTRPIALLFFALASWAWPIPTSSRVCRAAADPAGGPFHSGRTAGSQLPSIMAV